MTAGSIYAGAAITADDIQGIAPLAAVKTADQSVASTTLANDSTLSLNLAASSAYRFILTPLYTAVAGSDMSINIVVPSGATWGAALVHNGGGGTLYLDTRNPSFPSARFYGAGTAVQGALMVGTVLTGASGKLQVQFAQSASNATAAVMKAGSELDAWKVG